MEDFLLDLQILQGLQMDHRLVEFRLDGCQLVHQLAAQIHFGAFFLLELQLVVHREVVYHLVDHQEDHQMVVYHLLVDHQEDHQMVVYQLVVDHHEDRQMVEFLLVENRLYDVYADV